MIELIYFPKEQQGTPAYQIIQFNPGEPWSIVDGDELIGCMKKSKGFWNLYAVNEVPDGLATGIAHLIEAQHFNSLPDDIKLRWPEQVQEVIAQSDDRYLVICKAGLNFERFERVFRNFISDLIKDEWKIRFVVYNAEMTADFEFWG